MSELIYRQDAIEAYSKRFKTVPMEYADTVVQFGIDLRELPSAQRWIPCSERLPEKYTMVLTTTIGTDFVIQRDNESLEDAIERCMKSPGRVSIGLIGQDGWYDADYLPSTISPSAWMPLPEPWKGGEDAC